MGVNNLLMLIISQRQALTKLTLIKGRVRNTTRMSKHLKKVGLNIFHTFGQPGLDLITLEDQAVNNFIGGRVGANNLLKNHTLNTMIRYHRFMFTRNGTRRH
jgi:hypothetical protein